MSDANNGNTTDIHNTKCEPGVIPTEVEGAGIKSTTSHCTGVGETSPDARVIRSARGRATGIGSTCCTTTDIKGTGTDDPRIGRAGGLRTKIGSASAQHRSITNADGHRTCVAGAKGISSGLIRNAYCNRAKIADTVRYHGCIRDTRRRTTPEISKTS